MTELIASKYDVIVVGGGPIGAATAYHLAKQKLSVLIIDQFDPPHDQGSSHGQSRLLRVAYAEGEKYVAMVRRAISLWQEIEKETGAKLFEQTGVLYAGSEQDTFMTSVVAAAEAQKIPLVVIDQKNSPVSGLYNIPEAWLTLFEPEGGFLHTERCVSEIHNLAERHGAKRMINTKVVDIKEIDRTNHIETSNGTFTGKTVVVCAGAWAKDLVPSLKTKVSLQRKVMHWYGDNDGQYGMDTLFKPFVVHDDASNSWFYGVPDIDGTGVKIGDHNYEDALSHADQIDRAITSKDTDKIDKLVKRFLPKLGDRTQSKTCLYTSTENTDFILDRLPGFSSAFIASGFSGHGFKFATVIGEIMSKMVQGVKSDFDLAPFALSAHQ